MRQNIIYKGAKIATFLQDGVGTPLVFIHGFCSDSSVWNDFLDGFSNHYIIRIDLPGFGQSEIKPAYSIADMAHLLKYCLEHYKVERCILTGHSMGGYISLEFVKKYPHVLAGLCMFHSQPYSDTEDKILNRQKEIEFINEHGPVYYVKFLIPKLFAKKYLSNYSFQISKLTLAATNYPIEGIINALEAMKTRRDNTKVLQEISCPVLFIIGALDQAVPHENSLNQTNLPSISSIHILENVGHMGMFEARNQCISILKDFISFVEIHS